jgi:hypothetical protein
MTAPDVVPVSTPTPCFEPLSIDPLEFAAFLEKAGIEATAILLGSLPAELRRRPWVQNQVAVALEEKITPLPRGQTLSWN